MPWRPLSSKKRITVMKNNVPMAKEKADTAYAIAVAAQGEWNRMQGLKFAKPTRILEERKLEDTIYVVLVMLVVN